MSNRTFAIIKPDAVKKGNTGKIYDRIISAGFNILGAKLIKMSLLQSQGFYGVHKDKPFYEELTKFMSSGQSMVLALEKDNAVIVWREKPSVLQIQKKQLKEQSVVILLSVLEKMQFMALIQMKMPKKR